ncbi:leucine carboxyl methyltransferase [Xylaria palmicola]|nr:leucine carboxyl methyltransferase [Xylaria palmicola]
MAVVKPKSVAAARSARERAQDELVMQTNSSSIVSKRSVERIYYPDEPHYFRYFVKKFQRRAPLINRGYHLRLHVIDVAVRRFLERPSRKTKVVVNLGCGSDVLPWQCMTRYPDACHGAKFIDIDFPDLMAKKRSIVVNTPELNSVFEPLDVNAGNHVLLKSNMYIQIGCDLRNTAELEKALSTCLDLSECTFMFVAEVSITYMETAGADGVIKWAGSLSQAEFCLLEQILPDGPDHPFAKTMLSHFDKLKTPLKSVFVYPHTETQHRRFSSLGWSDVEAVSLWQIWIDNKWISSPERRQLDFFEPFDEWEEFALFASHYCVVIARNYTLDVESTANNDDPVATECLSQREQRQRQQSSELLFNAYQGTHGRRRFGATVRTRDGLGEQVFANTFGLGTNNRLKTCDLYSFNSSAPVMKMHPTGPGPRVCYGIVDRAHFGGLLVGGRTSPTTALEDCWHFSMEQNMWSPTDRLPVPLYRHAVAQLGQSNMTLLIGGRSDSVTIFPGALLHRPGSGWVACGFPQSAYQPVFGAMLVSFKKHHIANDDPASPTVHFEGILAGGLLADGTVAKQLLRWRLEVPMNGKPIITFGPVVSSWDTYLLACRFGASALLLDDERLVVVGGIQSDGIVPRAEEIVIIDMSNSRLELLSGCSLASFDKSLNIPRPLLVGMSVSLSEQNQLLVMGGGATCFSMGTYWNEGCYTFDLGTLLGSSLPTIPRGSLRFQKSIEIIDQPQTTKSDLKSNSKSQRATISSIPRIRLETADDFERYLGYGEPVILEGCDLGSCVQKWTGAYLTENIGPSRKVVVHEASSSKMDFNAKNFSYATKDFASFMAEVERGEKQYLRALSEEHPSDQPANLEADFPSIAHDFQLPPELSFVKRNQFSSVLRISGPVNMWLHYDVMANVYCQIAGAKRLLLFPPDDVGHLSFAPGASSSSIDVFSGLGTDDPSLAPTRPHEATLGPGDVLLLPPLWLHATAPLTDLGFAVNVFFRSLEAGYASGRDVYGNRDVAAYERGRQDVARIAGSLGRLPRDMQAFYMRRLVDEMAENIPR